MIQIRTSLSILMIALLLSSCAGSGKKAVDVSPRLEGLEDSTNIRPTLRNLNTTNDSTSSESFDRSMRRLTKFKNKESKENYDLSIECVNGNFQGAIKGMASYSEIKSASRLTVIGNCHFRQGAVKLALLHYDKALAINKKYFPALHNKAIVQLMLGNTKLALGELDRLYKRNPSSKVLRWNLSRLYIKRRIFTKSERYLSSLERDNSKDDDVLKGLAYSNLGRNRVTKSKTFFNNANFNNTRDPQDHLNYAIFLKKTGDKDKALFHVRKAQEETASSGYPNSTKTEMTEVANQLIQALNAPQKSEDKKGEK